MKADDSTLDPADLRAVELRAKRLLDEAGAWNRFPTPVAEIVAAANLQVAPAGAFDAASFLAYVKKKASSAAHVLKSALSKVLGIYDANASLIHIDDSVSESKQKFLQLHETGHHELPTHRRVFSLFQDCERTLAPEIADQFEREANNFARFALFQGATYQKQAADMGMSVRTPLKLAKSFGASVYASSREFARTHHRPCLVYILEPVEFAVGSGAIARVRRIEASASFKGNFGCPSDQSIDLNHPLGRLLPLGRKMTRPTVLRYRDKNGCDHECLGEAFDSTFNVILLIYPTRALTAVSVSVL